MTITGTDSCLNVRVSPGLFEYRPEGNVDMPVLNCLPDGFIGQLSFSAGYVWSPDSQPLPVQADGYWWWYILGQGWVADEWLTFLQEDGSPYGVRPELAGTGLIAFARPDGVWLSSADGTSSGLIYPVANDQNNIATIRWSPNGQLLAVGRNLWGDPALPATTDIIDLNGALIASYPGLAEPNWSPDGTRLSALRVSQPGDMGGYRGTPVIIDKSTGAETPVGPDTWYMQSPAWAPDGSAVALICVSSTSQQLQPDGTIIESTIDCGGDGLQVVSLLDGSARVLVPWSNDSTYYYSPSWSPDGQRIVMYSASGSECDGYSLFDVATGARTNCFALPLAASIGGGCGGNAESGASDWSPDGRTLAYHWQFRTGQNGVALVDVATGDRRLIQTTGASSISFSGDGAHLTFEASGYIWTADSDSSDVARLTDGTLPAWQPLP